MLPSRSIRCRRAVGHAIRGGLGGALVLVGSATALAQAIPAGVGYLTDSQEADGSWSSPQVRPVSATTEALRALQLLGASPAGRAAAVARLEEDPVEDTDDRARRILVLTAEGRLSGWVLFALPFVVFAMEQVVNPQYGRILLDEPMGQYALVAAFVMQILGLAMIQKIVNIKV